MSLRIKSALRGSDRSRPDELFAETLSVGNDGAMDRLAAPARIIGGIIATGPIVGRADPVLGERVHAVVVVGNNQALSEASIRDFCAERLSDYKVLDSVAISPDPLPRNANGKIQKDLLRNLKVD
jgi:acyl-CoA synthetase (AMP-forming)/AMP-acid ligase II